MEENPAIHYASPVIVASPDHRSQTLEITLFSVVAHLMLRHDRMDSFHMAREDFKDQIWIDRSLTNDQKKMLTLSDKEEHRHSNVKVRERELKLKVISFHRSPKERKVE